eukprot:4731189-Lingulodinium_polyedra.AAC.1
MHRLHFEPGLFKPYSMRRGGATHYFEEKQQYDPVLDVGRWQNTRTARIYIQTAQAALNARALTDQQRDSIEAARKHFLALVG